jgi:hypothetical protein
VVDRARARSADVGLGALERLRVLANQDERSAKWKLIPRNGPEAPERHDAGSIRGSVARAAAAETDAAPSRRRHGPRRRDAPGGRRTSRPLRPVG